jgi:2,4-dienoyl-CoA reductase-like NADH-dependent reductase (Old Yellow Enzyme family)
LNFAGWVKKISGKPVITVGCVGLDNEMLASIIDGASSSAMPLDPLVEMLNRRDFDLVAVGRPLLADPDWPRKVAAGKLDDIIRFTPAHLPRIDG